ncbi:MAG: PAS domain S-box protein [Desulfatibacillum sp.]|nr:PAS domain S-box protein [Desulfatibacillum sp.]
MTQLRAYDESIINTVREPLIVLDQDLRVVIVSRSFYEFFKVKPEETVGQHIYNLGNKQWDIPKLRELLETILPEKTAFDNYEVEHDFATIGRRIMLLNARQIEQGMGKKRIILLAIEDITERKKIEAGLEKTRNELAIIKKSADEAHEFADSVINTVREPLISLDQDLRVVTVSRSFYEFFKVKPEETVGQHIYDLGNKQWDIPKLRELLETILPEKTAFDNYEVEHDFATIGRRIMLLNARQIEQGMGKKRIILLAIEDITERKEMEAHLEKTRRELARNRLKEEEKFIENALNTLQDVFFVLDLDGRFIRWNKTMSSVTGYTDREISWKKITDFFREDEKKRVFEAILKVIEGGSASVDAIVVTKDGRQIAYAFSVSILNDVQNKTVGITGVGRDVTERNKAEAAIRKSEERFRQIAESTKEWIWEVNNEGFYTYSGNVVEEMLGYKPEEIVGKMRFFDFFPADLREQMKQDALKSFAQKKIFKKHINANVHRDGSIVILEKDGAPILSDTGDLIGYRGIDVDITIKQHLESQLRHAQKMEAIGTLAGGIAHDFNNILNVIMGYGAMVADTLEAGSPARENMNEVLIAADRAADLTRRLLVFSRKDIVKIMPVDINKIILGLKKMLARIIGESIEFNIEPADMPLPVLADAGQIEQILMNLAVNSKDAMREGGRLTISAGLVEVDDNYLAELEEKRPGQYALITVADTGHGMDKETQKKIFEPFFTTKGVGEGTGLGLAISYGIVKQHNGYTNVYSEPEQGTVFKIYLPLSKDTASLEKDKEAAAPVKHGNETVLVAEDDASMRKLMTIVLESFGYNVIAAVDGEDAIEKFMKNKERINIAILDMIMPKKTGKEVGEAIQKENAEIKILFASGYTMDIIKDKELAKTGSDFIHKPFRPKDLLIKVREILDR